MPEKSIFHNEIFCVHHAEFAPAGMPAHLVFFAALRYNLYIHSGSEDGFMKRFRPYCAGFIVLYVLTLLCFSDVVFTVVRQVRGTANDYMGSFSFFSYIIFALALCYTWQYVRAQVTFDGSRIRIAFPANVRPKEGQPRAMFIYRQGDTDMKFIDKTFDLKGLVRYGYVEDLGYDRIDKGQSNEKSKLFPVHEVALITRDNKRYHMNAAIYNEKQRREIFRLIREQSGVAPEGKLADEMK